MSCGVVLVKFSECGEVMLEELTKCDIPWRVLIDIGGEVREVWKVEVAKDERETQWRGGEKGKDLEKDIGDVSNSPVGWKVEVAERV